MVFKFPHPAKDKRRFFFYSGLVVVASAIFLEIGWNVVLGEPQSIDEATRAYISQVDIADFERNGTDYGNPKYSPARLGIPLDKVDPAVHYDFERLAETERRLKGVHRQKVLRHIFESVTKDARTNTDKHRAILRFLHKSSFHNALYPVYPDKNLVMDPLVVLTLGEMACGHVSRLAVDLFDSVGIRGRLVQLGGHVIAELYYEDAWHYLDGDIFGNGETLLTKHGTIPSVIELSMEPYQIDALSHYLEPSYGGRPVNESVPYPSWYYFGKIAYGERKGEAVYYEKTAEAFQSWSRFYGWNYFTTKVDAERKLHETKPFYQPGPVAFTRVEVRNGSDAVKKVHIEWNEAIDLDNDVLGYQVFVSRKSRGWAYGRYTGPAHLKPFMSGLGKWKPDMYESLYRLPPHEVRQVRTKQAFTDLALPRGATYFITVMPHDAHGEAVGKVLYKMSDEIRVRL